jgi:hypothetical protein
MQRDDFCREPFPVMQAESCCLQRTGACFAETAAPWSRPERRRFAMETGYAGWRAAVN